jgi:hypothetical protein
MITYDTRFIPSKREEHVHKSKFHPCVSTRAMHDDDYIDTRFIPSKREEHVHKSKFRPCVSTRAKPNSDKQKCNSFTKQYACVYKSLTPSLFLRLVCPLDYCLVAPIFFAMLNTWSSLGQLDVCSWRCCSLNTWSFLGQLAGLLFALMLASILLLALTPLLVSVIPIARMLGRFDPWSLE